MFFLKIKTCTQIFMMQYLFLEIGDNRNTECLTAAI